MGTRKTTDTTVPTDAMPESLSWTVWHSISQSRRNILPQPLLQEIYFHNRSIPNCRKMHKSLSSFLWCSKWRNGGKKHFPLELGLNQVHQEFLELNTSFSIIYKAQDPTCIRTVFCWGLIGLLHTKMFVAIWICKYHIWLLTVYQCHDIDNKGFTGYLPLTFSEAAL